MKKYVVLVLMAIFMVSCSQKVEFTGKVKGGSPLERVEFIDAFGVATLPLVNVGVDKDGNFKGSFNAPHNGMYVISYGGKENLVYLKKGQTLNISGDATNFPQEFKIEGDAKNNNDFLAAVQKDLMVYTQKLNLQEKLGKSEKDFVAELKKIQTDLDKSIDETAKKFNADSDVVEWKKNDIKTGILGIIPQYSMFKKQMGGDPNFKPSKDLVDFENSLLTDKDKLAKEHASYRQYLLSKMTEDFQKYAEREAKGKTDVVTSALFSGYLKQRKDLSQTEKDYLLAFVISQEINPNATDATVKKMDELINTEIKDSSVKSGLVQVQKAIFGLKKGEDVPAGKLVTADGKDFQLSSLKGKPTTVMFYASWTPYIKESTLPIAKQVMDFYGKNMNFAFINFDDTKEQFAKTSTALFKGSIAKQLYADGGMSGEFAKNYAVYGFKLRPSFIVLDKDGKKAGKLFFNLGDPEMVQLMDKLTGLTSPKPEATLQNDLLMPQQPQGAPAPQPAEAPQPAPTK